MVWAFIHPVFELGGPPPKLEQEIQETWSWRYAAADTKLADLWPSVEPWRGHDFDIEQGSQKPVGCGEDVFIVVAAGNESNKDISRRAKPAAVPSEGSDTGLVVSCIAREALTLDRWGTGNLKTASRRLREVGQLDWFAARRQVSRPGPLRRRQKVRGKFWRS